MIRKVRERGGRISNFPRIVLRPQVQAKDYVSSITGAGAAIRTKTNALEGFICVGGKGVMQSTCLPSVSSEVWARVARLTNPMTQCMFLTLVVSSFVFRIPWTA